MDVEVLAHVRAPASLIDDRRYLAIAQGILDFEPACVTNDRNIDGFDACSNLAELTESTYLRSSVVAESVSTSTGAPHPNTKPINRIHDRFHVSKNRIATRKLTVDKRVDNPPYRSPLRKPSSRITGTCTTPSSDKSVAAVNEVQPVLVPNTDQHTRKRPWSAIDTPSPRTAVVVNSQPPTSISLGDQSWSTWSQSASQPVTMTNMDEHTRFDSPSVAAKSRSCLHAHIAISGKSKADNTQAKSVKGQPSDVANSENDARLWAQVAITANPVNITTQSSAMQNSGHPETDASTVTPTQHSSSILQRTKMGSGHQSSPVAKSPIDLVTPDQTLIISAHDRNVQDAMVGHHYQEVQENINNNTATTATSTLSSMTVFVELKALPAVIEGPSSDIGQLLLPASKQPILRATAEALGMPERFKPTTMSRPVKGMERGYWRVPFCVVGCAEAQTMRRVAEQHRSLRTDRQPPLLKHANVTEDEFLTIWADLTEFITSGKAGPNVKVIRRNLSIGSGGCLDDATAQFHLQVYCYGEAIPYVYALLLVCSRMHVLWKPLQWISAIDELPVLTMTGDATRKDKLGSWTRYCNPGGKDFWNCS